MQGVPHGHTYLETNGFKHGPTNPRSINSSESVHSAQRAYRNAIFVLEHKMREVPSLDDMAKALSLEAQPLSLQSVERQLAVLKENHAKDLQALYVYQEAELSIELAERRKYLQYNETFIYASDIDLWDPEVWNALFGKFPNCDLEHEHRNQYEQLKHAYLVQFLELKQKQEKIEVHLQLERKRIERAFPQTIEEFNSKPKDLQVSAAKLFDARPEEKLKILEKCNWSQREVEALQKTFNSNMAWQGELRALMISAVGLNDPRKRRL